MNSEAISNLLTPLSIAIIMLSIGLDLCFDDFRRILKYPKTVIVGLLGQILILPVFAFAIAYFAPIPVEHKFGLILIASCPGGTFSNIISYFMKASVPLSITLTAFNSIVILFTIPTILHLALEFFAEKSQIIDIPFIQTFSNILITVVIPTLGGVFVNEKFPSFAQKVRKWLRHIGLLALGTAFVIVIFAKDSDVDLSLGLMGSLVPFALLLNFAAVILGYFLGKLFLNRKAYQDTIAVEVGMQNSPLALFIALKLYEEPNFAIMPMIYGWAAFALTVLLLGAIRKLRGDAIVPDKPMLEP